MAPAGEKVSIEERQLNLIQALLHTERPLRAEDLRERVYGYGGYDNDESFRRTFERDKQALLAMGVPLVMAGAGSDGGTEGYRIDRKRYYLQMPDLAEDELAALRLAVSLVQVGDASGEEALWRVGGVVEPGDGPLAGARAAGPVAILPVSANLERIFGAITERAVTSFTYKDALRTVDPLRLDFMRGRWYVSADDHDRDGDLRCFRVDRIQGDVSVGAPGSFERAPDRAVPPPSEAWGFEVDGAVQARLLVDESHADLVAHRLGPVTISERRDDASVVFDIEVRHRDGFRWLVIDLADHAEILEPAELRDDLVAWVSGALR
jgi:proteasome accessory factor B